MRPVRTARRARTARTALTTVIGLTAGLAGLAACGGGDDDTLTLVTYDSFPSDEASGVVTALAAFTEETGIDVEILRAGDAGTMVSKAALTAGDPEGDVMWGVDNTFLSRAIEAGIFEPYEAAGVDALPAALTALVPGHEATPVDFGDVCVNYDIDELDERGLAPPATLADLIDPRYHGTLVVPNPATSSPGLAFLLATIAELGDPGWQDYWAALRANDVLVVDGWDQAYYDEFSAQNGDRPLVVSYGTSPPAEAVFSDRPLDEVSTGVVASTCFRQVELAGVLRGTGARGAAEQLVDFLISEEFQQAIALDLFVYPANPAVTLPPEFVDFATVPDQPLTLDPKLIEDHRVEWIDRWTSIVTG